MPVMRRLSRAALGLALLALAGCGGTGVTVRRTGASAPPRPAGCGTRRAPVAHKSAAAALRK